MILFPRCIFVYSTTAFLSIVSGKIDLFYLFSNIPYCIFVYSLLTRHKFPLIDKMATLYRYTICYMAYLNRIYAKLSLKLKGLKDD